MNIFKQRDPNDTSLFNLIRDTKILYGSVGLEIGCYAGESTEQFLRSQRFSKFYCIDPWTTGYDENDISSKTNDIAEIEFDKRISIYNNVEKIKNFSYNVYNKIENNTLDFIYIDGDHRYNAVLNDIKQYYNKVKDNGIISGHDFLYTWPQVQQAVMEFFKVPPHYLYGDGSWAYNKNKLKIN